MTGQPQLTIIPVTWKQACAFVETHHRHHAGTRGCKWAVGIADDTGTLRGVALCGRPVSRHLDDGLTIEVNRTCTDGCPNANSALYGACWRIAAAMGYRRMVTYTESGESGVSLKAAGLRKIRDLPARGSWAASSVGATAPARPRRNRRRRTDAMGTGGMTDGT